MSSTYNLDNFRLYSTDVGLLVTLMFKDSVFTENVVYKKILGNKLSTNLGIVYENAVAQILATKGYQLYYHTYYDEIQKRNYEIDFIIPKGDKIAPIEVKSSGYKSHKSLNWFYDKYRHRISEKIVIHTKDLSYAESTLYLPIYLSMFL